jgi:hypothetical protein
MPKKISKPFLCLAVIAVFAALLFGFFFKSAAPYDFIAVKKGGRVDRFIGPGEFKFLSPFIKTEKLSIGFNTLWLTDREIPEIGVHQKKAINVLFQKDVARIGMVLSIPCKDLSEMKELAKEIIEHYGSIKDFNEEMSIFSAIYLRSSFGGLFSLPDIIMNPSLASVLALNVQQKLEKIVASVTKTKPIIMFTSIEYESGVLAKLMEDLIKQGRKDEAYDVVIAQSLNLLNKRLIDAMNNSKSQALPQAPNKKPAPVKKFNQNIVV